MALPPPVVNFDSHDAEVENPGVAHVQSPLEERTVGQPPLSFRDRPHLAWRASGLRPGRPFLYGFPSIGFGFQHRVLGDLMRRRTDYLLLLRPWSLPAFGAAFIAVV